MHNVSIKNIPVGPTNGYLHLIPFGGAATLDLLFVSVGEVVVLSLVEMGGGTVRVNTGRGFFSGGVGIFVELESNMAHD